MAAAVATQTPVTEASTSGDNKSASTPTSTSEPKPRKHTSQTALLLNRFVAQTAPGKGTSVDSGSPQSGPAAVASTIFGGDGGFGMGLWLPLLLIGAGVAVVLARRNKSTK